MTDFDDFDFEDMDFTDVDEAEDYEPIPVGVYTLQVTHAELCKSPKKGTPQIMLKLEVVEPEEYEGRGVSNKYIALTEASKRFTKRDLARLGIDVSKPVKMSEAVYDLLDNQVLARVKHVLNQNDGKRYAEVDSFLAPDSHQEEERPF